MGQGGTKGFTRAAEGDAGGNSSRAGGDKSHGVHCDFVRSLQDLPAWWTWRKNGTAATSGGGQSSEWSGGVDHGPSKLEEVAGATGGAEHPGARSCPACGIPGSVCGGDGKDVNGGGIQTPSGESSFAGGCGPNNAGGGEVYSSLAGGGGDHVPCPGQRHQWECQGESPGRQGQERWGRSRWQDQV